MSQDDYARSVARVVTAQLADAMEFDALQVSSLDVLSDLLLRYITEVGTAAHTYAELANRSEANPLDVVAALQDMGVSLSDLKAFASTSQADIPCAQLVAPFPQNRQASKPPTFAAKGEQPPPHIPDFLPALPDAHTYTATAWYVQTENDASQRQKRLADQQQAGEEAFVKLQARLAPENALLVEAALEKRHGPEADAEVAPLAKQAPPAADQAGAQNPFLAPVLWEEGAPAAPAVAPAGGGQQAQEDAGRDGEAGAEWAELEAPIAVHPALPMPFAPWQWMGQLSSQARLATSSRPQEDAYGGEVGFTRHGGRLKRGSTAAEGELVRFEQLRAAGGHEADATFTEEDVQMHEEEHI